MANRKRKAASAGFSETRSLNTRAKKVPNKFNNATFYHDLMEYVRTQMTPDQLQPFETLPSRSDYPDYYTFISQPISFAEIGAKYSKSNASNPLSILKDFDLLCVNAQTYNARFSLIYVISGLLQSAVHQYYLLTQVPSEYKQYASTVLETEARLLSELENHKPRVKNASYVCEFFIDPPGKSHNPEILQKVKELKLASNIITSTTKARELLWTGHYMDPAKFRSELDSFFTFLQEVYDPKSSNEGSAQRYQNAAALQRSFTSRYDKYIKGINLPQPEEYLEWSSEFSFEPVKDEAEELNQDASQDPLPETSSLNEGLSTSTGRTTTRSAWKQQQNKDVHDEEPPAEPKQEQPKSTGLTIKFKSGTSSSASSGASQKSRRKSSEKSEKRARMDKADTLEEEEEEEVVAEKPKPMPAPKIKLSFRGTRSRSRGNTQVDAEQESYQDDSVEDVLPATSSKKMASQTDKLDNQKGKIKILRSDSAKNLKTLEKEVKSQSKRRRKEEPEEEVILVEEPKEAVIIVGPKEEDEPTKETDTNGEVLESTSHEEPNEKLEEVNTNFERSHSSAQPIKPVYANPSRRSSDFDKKGLIRDVTFASVIPTITKYYQSKNLVPPGSQSSNLQVKFPSSDGFINRSFSLWVPYYQHTFTFSVLLHEWLNTSNFYHAEVTHNKTPLSTYKRSDTSPWATETEPITNRYEVVLVSGLNLIELVVVAQPKPLQSEDAVSKPRKGQKEYPADAAAKRQHDMKTGGLGEMSLRSTRTSADSQIIKGKGQADSDFLATRSVRSRTQNMFDPHGEPLQVEKLSLWVTMGAAPYA